MFCLRHDRPLVKRGAAEGAAEPVSKRILVARPVVQVILGRCAPPHSENSLYPLELLSGHDAPVVSFHIIGRNLRAKVLLCLVGFEVLGVVLLEQNVPGVAFVSQYSGVDTMCAVGAS